MSKAVTGRQIVAHREMQLAQLCLEPNAELRGILRTLREATWPPHADAPQGWSDWYASGDELH